MKRVLSVSPRCASWNRIQTWVQRTVKSGSDAGARLGSAGWLGSLSLAVVPYQGPKGDNLWKWIQREVIERVAISGTRTFGFHQHDVEGDVEAFRLLNYSGMGGKRFTDIGAMSLNGQNVAGLFNFNSTIIENRFTDPQAERSSLDYDRKPFRVNLGDIQGSLLNTNRFASFRKYLRGSQAQYSYGRFQVKGVASEVRGSAKTLSIQGTNSAGPYYLQHSQIVRGSEEIQVDGQSMRLGQDYVINYEVGSITFIGRIIPPTSTIVASFEALGFNSGFGRVTGLGATYNFGQFGRLGITRMDQTSASSGALSSRVELFQGSGAPSTPYFLQFVPLLTRPITVKLDGIPQVEGIDYHFDPDNPVIFFFDRFIPFTSTIEVVYTPRPTTTVDGNREVLGFDYNLPLGPNGRRGHVAYYQATGKLKSDTNPLEGTARGLEASFRTGPWSLRSSVRRVPNGYVSVETRGFNRNEEAVDGGIRYEGKKFELDANGSNSLVTLRQTNSDGDLLFRTARVTTLRGNAKYRPEAGVNWDLEHTQTESRNAGSETTLNRTQLSTSRSFGRLLTRFGLEQQHGRGPISDVGSTTIGDVDLRTISLDASYTAGEAWAFRGKFGISEVKTEEKDGRGADHQFGLTYTPSSRLSLTALYSKSDSGRLATLGGFQSGFGLGYGGNGFSGGLNGTGFDVGGTDVRLFQVMSKYQLSESSSLIANATSAKSAGSLTSNTDTKGFDLGLELALGRSHNLYASIARTITKFSSVASDVESTTFDLDFSGRTGNRLSYRLGASTFLTSGGSELFGQDSVSYDGSISYVLAPRQVLSMFATNGRRTGYLPQDERHYGMAYSYQLYRNIALTGSYRVRDVRNLSGSETSGAYKSRGFDLELTFNFGG